MDEKHVVIQAPKNEGSVYFNYKGTPSITLLALIGPNYEIIYFDVGCNGRISDGGVYNKCELSKCLEQNTLHLPSPRHFLVELFQLHTLLLQMTHLLLRSIL